MNTINLIGTFCMGLFVGWFLLYYLRRVKQEKNTVKGFGFIISVAFGAIIVKFLQGTSNVWGLYPIGIIVGLVTYILIALKFGARPEDIAYGRILFRKRKTK